MKDLQIGNVTLNGNCILAPMAGVTDLPFRLLVGEQGASMTCTEMISAKALYFKNKKTDILMDIDPREVPVSLQIFGSDPTIMGEMAKQIEERPFSILDINMGCPMPKIVNNREGSYLMKDPVLVGKIVERVAESIRKPVTVKIRKGFDEEHENAAEIAHVAQESGAAAIIVHGRTREQYYEGKADWNCIREVKERVRIPVIGNGDVVSAESAKAMIEMTGCDGIAVGRAAKGNPWIFNEIKTYLETGKLVSRPTEKEIIETILRHAKMQIEHKGDYIGVREMRKHISWYTTGLKHAAKLRSEINHAESFEEILALVELIFDTQETES